MGLPCPVAPLVHTLLTCPHFLAHTSWAITKLEPCTSGYWCAYGVLPGSLLSGVSEEEESMSPTKMRVYRQGLQLVYEEEGEYGFGWEGCNPLPNTPLRCQAAEGAAWPKFGYKCRAFKVAGSV